MGTYEQLEGEPRIIYVDDSATGSNDGSTWQNAFVYLQDAIEAAHSNDEIRVAQGTYRPDLGDEVSIGDRDAVFRWEKALTLKGGYKGFGAPDPDTRDCQACISLLSGDLEENDIDLYLPRWLLTERTRDDNSRRIISLWSNSASRIVIDGFTIQGAAGGAMDIDTLDCDVVVTDCIFRNNRGGVSLDSSVATFTRCAFLENAASSTGGAIEAEGCGTCRSGGAELDLFDCIFQGNYSGEHGGAIYTAGETTTVAVDCLFAGNTAGHLGAAIYESSFGWQGTDYRCGSYLSNCTFSGNNCIAVYIAEKGYAELKNCILHNNICGTWAGQDAQITLQQTEEPGTRLNMNYCLVEGWDGSLGGTGNFDADPRFLSPGIWDDHLNFTVGNYRLKTDSPCIDAGDFLGTIAPDNTDLAGQPRLAGPKPDIGAYEYQPGQPPQGIIYVDDSATGANDGSSWQNAFNYLQDALEASLPGYDIRVAQGIYRPDQGDEVSTGDREAAFRFEGPMIVQGGYAGFGQPDPDARNFNRFETILSGDLAQNDAQIPDARDLLDHPTRTDNSTHVVVIDGDGIPLIEGFTITAGNAGGSETYGGGLYVHKCDAKISDCVLLNNSSEYDGGAMAFNNGRVIFTRCSFINNAAAENGGAVHLDGCSTCRSMYGAFIDCLFIGNHAGMDGGAICSKSYTLTTCANSLFVGNTALRNGGALFDSGHIGSYLNCTFTGNNRSAIHIDTYAEVELTNCILWENAYDTNTGLITQLTWQTSEYYPDPIPAVNYSCIQSWDYSLGGVGNFDDAPRFISPGSWDIDLNYTLGNYRLRSDSPCINNGDPNYPAEPTVIEIPTGYYWPDMHDPEDYIARATALDLDALPRVAQGTVDMGPYEYYTAALIAHWKLDNAGDHSTAIDSVGDNHGRFEGDPMWTPDGVIGGALWLDHQNTAYVNCSNSSNFDLTSQITVAAWVYIGTVHTDWQTVISKGDSAWRLSTAEDEYRYHFAVTGGPPWNYINGDIEVAQYEWRHVCGTYDGQNLRLYIDGTEDPAGPVPESQGITTNDYDVLIGENQERPGRWWDGKLDDVRIYNYALTPMEIVQLFAPTVIYVDQDAPGLNNGTSWTNAFKCLQDALAVADEGMEIRVAQGRYTPDDGTTVTFFDRDATFQLKNGLTIKGGYAGYGHPDPDVCNFETCKTILSGDLLNNDAEVPDPCRLADEPTRADNSRHIITAEGVDQTAILDGLTIAGGYAQWSNGAGMQNNAASPTINNCTFQGNFAEGAAAMSNYNNSNPILTNCTFTENAKHSVEGGNGGAMSNGRSSPTLINCTFTRNWSSVDIPDHGGGYGGAIANYRGSPTITGCTFTENTALCGGGAILNDYLSAPTITDCIFERNTALGGGDRWANGGAMQNDGGDPIVSNCIFIENTGRDGGAIHNAEAQPVFTNCIFTRNTARDLGGAIYTRYHSDVKVANCTFVSNQAPNGSAVACYTYRPENFSNLEITNSIIWDGENSIWKSDESTVEITYSDVQHGYPGLGNIDEDPCFVDASSNDYHLRSAGWRWNAQREEWVFDRETSRCIDAGNPGSPLGDEPLTIPDDPENEYGLNLRINMGAYGGTAQASIAPYDWALLADINNDGAADFCDFACAGPYWLKTAPQQPCDLDRDGKADPADLELFSIDWLKTTLWQNQQ
ncbi:MAG: right-handed parallel beta-helix repeat-containing protein [Planctomycetota bacterium]|jgi:predicted outer membrane repeat protein